MLHEPCINNVFIEEPITLTECSINISLLEEGLFITLRKPCQNVTQSSENAPC